MSIDLRMFDVGLGSATLLEFVQGHGQIRVLADGGDGRAGVDVEEALAVLPATVGPWRRPLIDLVIGTHYDADHLDGLTEIVRRGRVDVGEFWLPPVADDTDAAEAGRMPRWGTTLVGKFGGDGGAAKFDRYVAVKRARIELIDRAEGVDVGTGERPAGRSEAGDSHAADERRYFANALARAEAVLGERGCEHDPDADLLWETGADERHGPWYLDLEYLARRGGIAAVREREGAFWRGPSGADVHTSLAWMRLTAAKDGINACALRSLLLAIGTRGSRVRQFWCDDDRPLVFGWDAASRRFRPGAQAGPEIRLLAPTERLVAERRDRLPRSVVAFAAKRWDRLEGLTHSNQLSYVLRIDFEEQGLLVTGDSGFDGFAIGSDSAGRYETALTDHLKDLAVVQVPHHGGINRHFYRAMEHAGFSQERRSAYLLLSHEAASEHRPNGAFASYMRRTAGRDLKLLFTGRPARENVEDYVDRIHDAEPSKAGPGGDVVLRFDHGWRVLGHGANRPDR